MTALELEPSRVDVADIVVVNHNTVADLRRCLEALEAACGIGTIWVADTGSTDGSLEMVHEHFPDVRTAAMPENPGYGTAANRLIARCESDVVVLLNADVQVDQRTIDELRRHVLNDPRIGVAGPRLIGEDGTSQRSDFADPTLGTLLWRESGLGRQWEHAHHVAGRRADDEDARCVPWVLGAALAIRRAAFDDVGGFDPGYFLYYEETDLCRRMRAAGWTIEFVPRASAMHAGGTSTGQHHAAMQRTLYRSLSRYHSIHGGASTPRLRAAVAAIMTARLTRDGVLGLVSSGERRARRRAGTAAWRGVLADALRGWNANTATSATARRTDWLTLLPTLDLPHPTVSVSDDFSDSERRALAQHFGVESVGNATAAAPADVVVMRTEGRFDAAAIVAAVAPGGTGLVQHTRRLPGHAVTSARAGAALRHAGADVVGRWWVLPDAASPRRFVPLDAPGPLRWYLDSLLIADRRTHRLARACMRIVPRSAGWIARSHLTAFTRGPARPGLASTAMIRAAGVHDDARMLVMSSNYDAGSRAVVLPFSDGAARPDVAIKVSVAGAINETTRREHAHLTTVRSEVSKDLASTMPVPIALFDWRGHAVAVQSMLHGPTLDRVLRERPDPGPRVAILHEVTDWVTRLHRETGDRSVWSHEQVERWIREPFAQVRDEVEVGDDIDRLLDRVERLAEDLIGRPLPLVHRHVDLGPWNVIRTANGLGVTDWESAPNRPVNGRGLPVCDLDYFLKYWLHIVAEDLDPAIASRFPCIGPLPAGAAEPYFRAARRMMLRYCTRVGVDPAFVPVLSTYNWIEHTLNRRARNRILESSVAEDRPPERLLALASYADVIDDDPFVGLSPIDRRRRIAIAAPFALKESPSHGGARVIRDTARALAWAHHVRVIATVARRDPVASAPVAAPYMLQEIERPPSRRLRRARLFASALAGRPAWVCEWASPMFDQELAKVAADWHPDVLHVEFVLLADALAQIGADGPPVIITDHDPPIAAAIDQFGRDGWAMRAYRALDAQAWVRAERRAARRATVMCVFAHDDRALLERLHLAAPVVVLPFGIALPQTPPRSWPQPRPTLAFVGSHHHPPNADALQYLVERLMPLVWDARPDVELLAIGSDPPSFIRDADPRIKVTGFVPDLGASLADAALVVAPMTSGRGMRVKVLEAMALGKAVVATPLAVRGLPLDALDTLTVVDGEEAFAAAVLELLADDERRIEMGQGARSWAERWLAPDAVIDRYDDLYALVDALREVTR